MKINRGDVVTLRFPYTDEPEDSKLRPALIVQNDVGNKYSENTIVVMITSSVPDRLYPVQVLIPSDNKTGLKRNSIADTGIIFTVSKKRINNVVGKCNDKIMKNVDKALSISLGFDI